MNDEYVVDWVGFEINPNADKDNNDDKDEVESYYF